MSADDSMARASVVGAAKPAHYDGFGAAELAVMLDVPGVLLFNDVPSTQDAAHALAASGAEAGTLVLAEAQSAGRGRMGRPWTSERGGGIWLTLVERPTPDDAMSVLSLRVALGLAAALDPFVAQPVEVKWPNDLYTGGGKLAGILLESRWRAGRLDWLAVGVGINVTAPRGLGAASLRPGIRRVDVLCAAIPAIRAALASRGPLASHERTAFARRDLALGRACSEPAEGVVAGIDPTGALLVDTTAGRVVCRGGSLVLSDAAEPGGGQGR